MAERKKPFGGRGRKQGDPAGDPMGTVRRSPDQTMLAIHWPSPPSAYSWHATDRHGSLGYEKPERIAHWPVTGSVPGTPAAGMELQPHAAAAAETKGVAPKVVDVQLPAPRPLDPAWAEFDWPTWIPETIRLAIEDFWSSQDGRGPAAWRANMAENGAPELGQIVTLVDYGTKDRRPVTGRFVFCWNNMCRVVCEDGTWTWSSFDRNWQHTTPVTAISTS